MTSAAHADATAGPPGLDEVVAETDVARLVGRFSSEYMLRLLQLLTELHGGDLMTAIITQAIIAANTAHLDTRTADGPRYASLAQAPPDAVRRPISVLALSRSLGLPFETTRRHVNRLVAAGRCVRMKGGVIVPASALQHPKSNEATLTNLAYVRRFIRALKAAGVCAD